MSNNIVLDQVSEDRWKQAQQWEEQHWIGAQKARARFGKNHLWRVLSWFGLVPKHRGDDWNLWWKIKFRNYEFLPARVENALEVGCGPYTNLRLMLDRCRPAHVVLSDPLIRTYVKFKLTFVAEMYRDAACILDDHPLEELPFAENYFDLVIMINVLDHVRDARQCMINLLRVLKPGGILILGQDLSNDDDQEALRRDRGAVGHPIKLDDAWFNTYLGQGLSPILQEVLARAQGRDPNQHYATLVYAGRKQ
ncbi:MAG TPA: class I SAM-dependent methyltransferase [Candidatus Dormibacteraeota bacterium]|nr:class I SAM-dependent methyltransferase [Verrucomicrobiae bacterium]HXJ71217.1 class I SAM-dependent methyltransferase [Candidatus Dormibacteraeota bacterium]